MWNWSQELYGDPPKDSLLLFWLQGDIQHCAVVVVKWIKVLHNSEMETFHESESWVAVHFYHSSDSRYWVLTDKSVFRANYGRPQEPHFSIGCHEVSDQSGVLIVQLNLKKHHVMVSLFLHCVGLEILFILPKLLGIFKVDVEGFRTNCPLHLPIHFWAIISTLSNKVQVAVFLLTSPHNTFIATSLDISRHILQN